MLGGGACGLGRGGTVGGAGRGGHSAMDEPSLLRRRGLQVRRDASGSANRAFPAGKLRQGVRKAGNIRSRPLPICCPERFAHDGKGGDLC